MLSVVILRFICEKRFYVMLCYVMLCYVMLTSVIAFEAVEKSTPFNSIAQWLLFSMSSERGNMEKVGLAQYRVPAPPPNS